MLQAWTIKFLFFQLKIIVFDKNCVFVCKDQNDTKEAKIVHQLSRASFFANLPSKILSIMLHHARGAWIAEWSSHSTTMNIGTLRPGP